MKALVLSPEFFIINLVELVQILSMTFSCSKNYEVITFIHGYP